MRRTVSISKYRNKQLILLLTPIWLCCVDPVELSLPKAENPVIVEGLITDQPGPDTIKIATAYVVDGKFHARAGIVGATIVVSDDAGNHDQLTDIGNGYYVTNTLVGAVGRSYSLLGQLPGGTTFTSGPEYMAAAGSIDSLFFEYTSARNGKTGEQEPGFNVYVNSTAAPGSSLRFRWKFRGTYVYFTDPSLIQIPGPLPCAAGCVCCTCYATEHEPAPIVTDTRVVGELNVNRTLISYVPINGLTFNDHYRVDVQQMEVSQSVYDFYFAVERQINNASNLFQPPFFELKGNVSSGGPVKIQGVFSAAAISTKHIYIYRTDVPFLLYSQPLAADCRAVVPHATIIAPPYWN